MGRYSELSNFVHLDSNNRFRIISPTFWNSTKGANNYCPSGWADCKLSVSFTLLELFYNFNNFIDIYTKANGFRNWGCF